MELRIGVVGAAGFIGREHTKRLNSSISNARVTAVSDINEEKINAIAKEINADAYTDGEKLIQADNVDAIVVTSWDPTHAQFVMAAVKAGKPVFCEKPLASTQEDCKKILECEEAAGKRLVQVGFMRRFDPGYLEMKSVLDSGILGKPLLVHCKSRTPVTPPQHTTRMHATNVVVHEIDVLRWLLNDEFKEAQVILPRSSCHAPEGLCDPQLMLLTTEEGVAVDVEVAVNSHYGYEIECEVVCENGTISLPQPSRAELRLDHTCSHQIMKDWALRFTDAYQAEFQAWVDSCLKGTTPLGSSSWDGYAACIVGETLGDAQGSKCLKPISMPEKPAFYL